MSDWQMQLKRTVTITQIHRSKSYPDMTAEEAKAYELGLLNEEKLEQFAQALQFVPECDIEVSEEVQIFPVV